MDKTSKQVKWSHKSCSSVRPIPTSAVFADFHIPVISLPQFPGKKKFISIDHRRCRKSCCTISS